MSITSSLIELGGNPRSLSLDGMGQSPKTRDKTVIIYTQHAFRTSVLIYATTPHDDKTDATPGPKGVKVLETICYTTFWGITEMHRR
jgi:hypothetical protein